MFSDRWFPWIHGPTPAPVPMSEKEEQDQTSEHVSPESPLCHHTCPMMLLSALCCVLLVTCVAVSVMYTGRSCRKRLTFDHHNNSVSSSISSDLNRDNVMLSNHNAELKERNRILNQTLVQCISQDLTASLERGKLMKEIEKLTLTNVNLTEEYSKVLEVNVEQEEALVNMSATVADLAIFNTQLQMDKQKQEDDNKLMQESNQELQDEIQEKEILQKMLGDVRAQTHNLTSVFEKQKTELSQYKEEHMEMEAKLKSVEEDLHSLNHYCPVVNQNTQERVCKTCAEGWTMFQSKCYYFSSRVLPWTSSRAWCQSHRADLLVISAEEEQNFTHEISHKMDQSNTRLWIGLSDIEQEGDWRWVDGRQVTSSLQYWLNRPGYGTEPDNWRSEDPEGEDCGHMDTREDVLQSWMDGSCKLSYRWICQKNL